MTGEVNNRMLNKTYAGQIAMNLDKMDGSDGKISKNVWDGFWAEHGGNEYKEKKKYL